MKLTNDQLKLASNTIRCLCSDMIDKANSGHPGAPLGMADLAATLWLRHLRVDPKDLEQCAQWDMNNQLASHPNTGLSFGSYDDQLKDRRLILRIPSQAVCARWMPNLEGIVSGNPLEEGDGLFFGIQVFNLSAGALFNVDPQGSPKVILNYFDRKTGTVHDTMTVFDGWGNEFYYYSPPPFQSYRIWSAGANEKTFPPWMPFSALKNDADRKTAANWMADDVMYLSN